MSTTFHNADEIGRRGEELYEREIRAKVEAGHRGRFLALDIATGDYEIAGDDMAATNRLLARHPKAIVYGMRIGDHAAYHLRGPFHKCSPSDDGV